MKVFSFRNFRIVLLLLILAIVAIYTQNQRLNTTSWYQPIDVIIYPINGDGSVATDNYIKTLAKNNFVDIDTFFISGAKQYQLAVTRPIITRLGSYCYGSPPVTTKRSHSPY
ncbi:MAG: hypothetical protein Q9N32_07710 [Gammaproteobacteria bacterium]|nr:hypothetical protein [Gammaproteobacteria bacterium]